MILTHDDPRLSWHGHVSFHRTPEFTRPVRIPWAGRALFHPELVARGITQAGIRLSFRSDTGSVAGKILPVAENQNLDLFVDGVLHGSVSLADADGFDFRDLPAGEHLLEFWLPQRGDFALREIEVDDGARVEPYVDERPRWVTYGSSITHCGSAASPSLTWPAIVARERGVNLTCLGYGGQCHLDIQVARMMRDLPADFLSVCAGINVYGHASLNARTFVHSLVGFVQILREKHPTTPLALISPIFSFDREDTPNAVGWTLQQYRRGVEEAVEVLAEHGDGAVFYIDGLELFGEDLGHLLPDKLHPDAEGYKKLAANFLRVAAPVFMG